MSVGFDSIKSPKFGTLSKKTSSIPEESHYIVAGYRLIGLDSEFRNIADKIIGKKVIIYGKLQKPYNKKQFYVKAIATSFNIYDRRRPTDGGGLHGYHPRPGHGVSQSIMFYLHKEVRRVSFKTVDCVGGLTDNCDEPDQSFVKTDETFIGLLADGYVRYTWDLDDAVEIFRYTHFGLYDSNECIVNNSLYMFQNYVNGWSDVTSYGAGRLDGHELILSAVGTARTFAMTKSLDDDWYNSGGWIAQVKFYYE